jgi:hypothetical protein
VAGLPVDQGKADIVFRPHRLPLMTHCRHRRELHRRAMINDRLADLRKWALCLAVYCVACTSAVACMPATERGILFEHVPTDIDAPVVIEATIYDQTQVGDIAGNQMMLMSRP